MSIPPQDEPLTNRPVAISLQQDVSSTSDCHILELENSVQRLMEAHLAPNEPIHVNTITSLCEIYSDSYDTHYNMENPEQDFVEYASSRNEEAKGKQFTMNQGPRSFNEAANAWKGMSNFNWAHTQTFTSPLNGSFSTYSSSYQMKLEKALIDFDSHQERSLSSLGTQLGKQQDDMISKTNILWKTVLKSLIAIEYKDHEMTVKSEEEFEEETEKETKEEEEDSPKHFDAFPTMKELGYHEWLLKNTQPMGKCNTPIFDI
nr:hypothetical protein [Tanacetum cinerariifolium]